MTRRSSTRILSNQIPVGIFLKKMDMGKYVFWNRASEEIFERTAQDVIGKTDEEIFPAAMAAQIKREDAEALASRVEIKYKKITTKTRGQCVIHMIVVPIYDSQRSVRYMLGIAEDVTDEAVTLKKDLIFSITRSDILEQLAVIMTYLERASSRPRGKRCRRSLTRPLDRWNPSGTRLHMRGHSRAPVSSHLNGNR